LAVPCFRRFFAGWPCHVSGGFSQVGRAMFQAVFSQVGRAMAQAVCRRLFATETRVRAQASPCDVWWTTWHRDRFSSSSSVSPLSIIPPVLHTDLHAALTRKANGRRPVAFQKAMLF